MNYDGSIYTKINLWSFVSAISYYLFSRCSCEIDYGSGGDELDDKDKINKSSV